jgi:hypothetical protein
VVGTRDRLPAGDTPRSHESLAANVERFAR